MEYAVLTAERLGDRIEHWIMLNEPSVYACLGHAIGVHAPGLTDLPSFHATTHHLNLAQGSALQALRSVNARWKLGTTLNVHRGVSADGSKASSLMVQRHNDLWNGCFLQPLLAGSYPRDILPELEPYLQSGDLTLIQQPIDFLGINHYSRSYILAKPEALLGYEHAAPPPHLPRTSFDWEINPDEFRDTLLELHELYQCPPIYITENGAFFEGYINAMQEAQKRGVEIRGYFVWSLLDNFEWACGYRPTFGLIKVDFENQKRIPKDSYFWYRDLIKQS
jgi:beta-glucosidase